MNNKKILVVVDYQYDFFSPDGTLYVNGAEQLQDKIATIIPNFDYVIFTKDSHGLNHCSFKENGGIWPMHCVWNSIGEGIPIELLKAAKDYGVVAKGGNVNEEEYGAFSDDMEFFYNIEFAVDPEGICSKPFSAYCDDVDELVVCGIAGDYCVVETLKNIIKWFKDTNRIKVYLDGVASIDGGEKLNNFIKENNIKIYKYESDN
jgi:nicotinamidase-related amidase